MRPVDDECECYGEAQRVLSASLVVESADEMYCG